jgi:signal transduction histidine kinase
MRRSRSLRRQLLAIALAGLAIGAAAAVALARLMILDSGELRTVVAVLLATAAFATTIVLIASGPLERDLRRLESTVRAIEAGDRTTHVAIERSDEIGHVARAVDELNVRLDQLERERAGFEQERSMMLSSVSHDLRTPLSALQAALEAVIDGVAPDPERYLRSMRADVEALAALIDDLFLLSRIETGRMELAREPVDLGELADEAIESLAPMAAARDVTLELESDARVAVVGSASALGRVVRNLLDNAVRHAPEGSTVVIAVSADRQPTVRVRDDGAGFSPAFAAHAFDRFTRSDASRNRTTGGAGLGLAIARGLVEAHGGRIWIEDAPGGNVAFELPAA